MNSLPYLQIDAENLIPHPSNTYTIVLDKSEFSEKFLLQTESFSYKNDSYKNAFLIVSKYKNIISETAAFCNWIDTSYSQEEILLTFTSFFKVKVKQILSGNKLAFTFLSLSAHKKYYNDFSILSTYLNSNLLFKDFFISKDRENYKDPNYLNNIYIQLSPQIDKDFEFFNTSNPSKQLNILYSLLLETQLLLEFQEDLSLSNELFPKEVLIKLKKEKKRLSKMNSSSSEYSNIQDYIDLLLDIPWNSYSEQTLNPTLISKEISSTHYGLENVKENILEYFYLHKLTGIMDGAVLLFNGPPGTGKTTIAKAIAKATNREFISISLAGVGDESEIRGHRRTYVGSKPGRIVSAIANSKTMNPIILIDELDKIKPDKGDPFSALLELLDPEQNYAFIDRYLEVPIDLSKVTFICTSNSKNKIPEPLLNRCEIIEFQNYSFEEKKHILINYIIPKIISNYKLKSYNIIFESTLLDYLSKQKDLRNLKKIISRLLRNKTKKLLLDNSDTLITLEQYKKIFNVTTQNSTRRIGFATNI